MIRLPAGLGLSLLAIMTLGGCASRPQLVMVNPGTGAMVDCQMPDPLADSGGFLVSRACLSACQAHGFRPVPGVQGKGSNADTPKVCDN
jgi:hypothetical protein